MLLLANLTIGGYQRRLEEMATVDKLTGLSNRQVFDAMFDQVLKSAKRRNGVVSAVMCDLDNFKQINDEHGHNAGDLVLQTVAQTLREQIRESDIVCRWGGEEFLLVLPDCDLDQAVAIAEKVRAAIENRRVTLAWGSISVTVSLGAAQLRAGERRDDLIKRSDEALYVAKAAGRNRVRQSN